MRRVIPSGFLLAVAVAFGTGQPPSQAGEQGAADPPAQSSPAIGGSGSASSPAKPPERKEEKPLLLLEDEEGASTGGADNSRCQVCHLNLVQEELAAKHARAQVGCAKCHGPSDAHIADESWASGGNGTAPDRMFPPAKINALCLGCHPKAKIAIDYHNAFLSGSGKEKYCTDCHGKHRLAKRKRKCKWK